jgi:hypothetical protein
MALDRNRLYRFPWSKTDNPGAWVEVTDECDLECRGCYRHRLEGHRPLEAVRKDILEGHRLTRCDSMAIAGGEPLIYPHIVEVVDFMARRGIKPVILTNGEKLDLSLAKDLKKAGLAKFHFHVDSGQNRPGWEGRSELDMNALRQRYADLVWELGWVQCGYNLTVYRSSLKDLPGVVEWCLSNIHKVQHISLIAFRLIPGNEDIDYWVDGDKVDLAPFQKNLLASEEINLTTEDMFAVLEKRIPGLRACAYLGGTADPLTTKYLIAAPVGSTRKIYGGLGPKTMEIVQVFYHLWMNRYCAFLRRPAGKKIFALSVLDPEIRRAFRSFLKACVRNPARLFDRICVQSIHLQQPNEILGDQVNLCDGCANMMHYQGRLINSCRLDEYRMFGGEIRPVRRREGTS